MAGLAKKGYRPDLRAVSTLRFSSVVSSLLGTPNALSLELAGKHLWCMKVERGHVCNINTVHLHDSPH